MRAVTECSIDSWKSIKLVCVNGNAKPDTKHLFAANRDTAPRLYESRHACLAVASTWADDPVQIILFTVSHNAATHKRRLLLNYLVMSGVQNIFDRKNKYHLLVI